MRDKRKGACQLPRHSCCKYMKLVKEKKAQEKKNLTKKNIKCKSLVNAKK